MKFSSKKSALLTLSILLSLSAPTYAAQADTNADEAVRTPDVVVTATRTEAEVKAVPSSVEVITKDDIEKLGANDVYSALRLASNVDIRSNGALGYNVNIRGMNTNHTLILIDGKRTADEDTNDSQSYYALGRINIADVERIEIVRGSASAQYGSDALGGVINVITKKSTGKQSVTVGASTGSNLMSNYYHVDLGKQGNFSGTFDMNFSKTRKNMMPESTQSYYYGPSQNYNFDGNWDLGNNKQLDLSLGYYTSKTESDYGPAYNPSAQYGPGLRYRKIDSKRYDYSLGYSGKTDRSDYYIRTYYSKLDKDRTAYILHNGNNFTPDNPKRTATTQSNNYDMWGIEAKNTVQLDDKNLLTYGAEYRKNTVEGSNLGNNNPSKDLTSYAGYIQDEWMPNENWLVIPIVRYDHFSQYGSKTSPNIGVTYFINDNNRIKANWGKAFKAPTITELYGALDHMGMFELLGNPDLKAEESTNWDISYETGNDTTWGKLTYFHNDVDNLITTESQGSFGYIPGVGMVYPDQKYVNVDSAEISGVEFEVGHHLSDKWTVKATSNWLDAVNNDTNEKLEGRARNTTTLQLSYDDGNAYGINSVLWNEWVTDMHGAGGHGMGGASVDHSYSTTNFVINKKFGEGNRVYAGVDNIFDKQIADIYLDGRIWRVGAEWTF